MRGLIAAVRVGGAVVRERCGQNRVFYAAPANQNSAPLAVRSIAPLT